MDIKQNSNVFELIDEIKDTAPSKKSRESWLQTLAAFEMFEKEILNESEYLKELICNSCKEQLKGTLSIEQLEKFEDVFYTSAEKYLFSRKKENANKEKSVEILRIP